MAEAYTYLEAISLGFPGVQCHVVGDENVYENLVWDGGNPIPDKVTLDTWILNNSKGDDRRISVFAFRNRFLTEEKVAIELASIDNPSADMQTRQVAAMIRVMNHDLSTATWVYLNNPSVINGLNLLEQIGILAPGRADEILNAPIREEERPVGL